LLPARLRKLPTLGRTRGREKRETPSRRAISAKNSSHLVGKHGGLAGEGLAMVVPAARVDDEGLTGGAEEVAPHAGFPRWSVALSLLAGGS
jgi:hypothetical protein